MYVFDYLRIKIQFQNTRRLSDLRSYGNEKRRKT